MNAGGVKSMMHILGFFFVPQTFQMYISMSVARESLEENLRSYRP
jgi:hypothetical protein